ncbi:MAG: M24 family metallopeptidase [Candidatus Dormibacteria bacterium]
MTLSESPWPLLEPGIASSGFGTPAESREKMRLLRDAMAERDLDAVYLEQWANVAWLCGGRGNRVVLDHPTGQCGILVGHNGAWLLVANNEEARCRAEGFAGLDLPVVAHPWYKLPLWQAAQPLLPASARLAADIPAGDASPADPMVVPLRQHLRDVDIARYRGLGRDATEALETAVVQASEDWSELEVAGTIAAALKARAIEGGVVLVGSRARAEHYRHFVPTEAVVRGGFTASITATRHGLHASATRAISFGPLPQALRERFESIRDVDRALLSSSRPGMSMSGLLEVAARAYARAGYYDEWKEHHQGGTAGYSGREVFALPGSDYTLGPGTAVAWNPTVPGAKSEDTFIVAEGGLEWLTFNPASDWPLDEGPGKISRPAARLV